MITPTEDYYLDHDGGRFAPIATTTVPTWKAPAFLEDLAIETGMLNRFTGTADKKAALVAGVPVKRVGRPEEIAQAILFVASRPTRRRSLRVRPSPSMAENWLADECPVDIGPELSLRASVTSTAVSKLMSVARCGPPHRLQRLAHLNGRHPRPVNAYLGIWPAVFERNRVPTLCISQKTTTSTVSENDRRYCLYPEGVASHSPGLPCTRGYPLGFETTETSTLKGLHNYRRMMQPFQGRWIGPRLSPG